MQGLTEGGVLMFVRAAVAETLGLDDHDVDVDAALGGDLGAGCFELQEVLRRIERKLEIRISVGELAGEAVGRRNIDPRWTPEDAACGGCTVRSIVSAVQQRIAAPEPA